MHISTLILRISLAALLLASSLAAAAGITGIHSHNDYEQPRPFWGAYEAGAASIEADIWLVDGKLMVAHDRKQADPVRLLQRMYLDPIRDMMRKNGGSVYPGGKGLQLLVDLKSGPETLDALVALIRDGGYADCFNVKANPGAAQIVITGDKIKKERFTAYPDFIFFDGLPHVEYTPVEQQRVALISSHYGKFTKWKGEGRMDKAEQKRIRAAVRKAHRMGSKFRLWAFPDNKEAWTMTQRLGMDFINTDHPAQAARFLDRNENWLFKDGQSDYRIVLRKDASPSERKAAEELQAYIRQISGAELPITGNEQEKGKKIIIGFGEKAAAVTGQEAPEADYEGYTCRTVGKDLLIYGGAQRGTMYGVFDFLEQELGVKWLTPKCTVVPKMERYALPGLDRSEEPALALRYDGYFAVEHEPVWSAHNKENMKWNPTQNEYGNIEAYWNAHTMGQLLPSKEFFAQHPEYFSLRDGKRIPNGQLCLSNPAVLEICKTRLADVMRKHRHYRIYSLSQNDNFSFCQCPECTAIAGQYGGQSGLMVWFVNQVADAVRDEFPDKFVGTFAYQYTRQAPKGIVPRNNVVIRLCSIECCFAHPLTAGCPQNQAFMKDLAQWADLAPHLFIWDYIVDYAQYISPWPNFQVLAPNIETFRKHKAIGIYEEAQYQSNGAEFEEMKAWVTTKLLWNPQLNTDSLVQVFIEGYYGKAAPLVMDYYRLCQSLIKPDVHFGIYIRENHEIYSDEFVEKAFALLDKALQTAGDEETKNRVERVRMQPLYLYCKRNREKCKQDGNWDELVRLMRKYNARPEETVALEDFIKKF